MPRLHRPALFLLATAVTLTVACNRNSPQAPAQQAAANPHLVDIPATPDAPPPPGAEKPPEDIVQASDAPAEQVQPTQPLLPAGNCTATLHAADAPAWDAANIDVPSACDTFTIELEHTGKMPAWIMGHNVVITRTEDIDAVERAGIGAGPYRSYVEPSDKRILAKSKLAGGGQRVKLSFKVARLNEGHFSYFCTFPGHHKTMRGTLTLR